MNWQTISGRFAFAWRKSALRSALLSAIPPAVGIAIGGRHRQDGFDEAGLLAFVDARRAPSLFSTTEKAVRRQFDLSFWPEGYQPRGENRARTLARLAAHPQLARAFLFHGDGRVRAAALDALQGPLAAPVSVYGLVARLNDWSPIVREAAQRAFARCYAPTPVDVLLPAVWVLLVNSARWSRWGSGGDAFRHAVLTRQDLVDVLIERTAADGGGAGRILRILCQSEAVDACLPRLALEARQPAIRAIALTCLSIGHVRWPTGTVTRHWIDKRNGKFRMFADFQERPIRIDYDLVAIVARALQDKTNAVRKEAFDALIEHRKASAFGALITTSLAMPEDDFVPSIRLRHRYLRKMVEDRL